MLHADIFLKAAQVWQMIGKFFGNFRFFQHAFKVVQQEASRRGAKDLAPFFVFLDNPVFKNQVHHRILYLRNQQDNKSGTWLHTIKILEEL